MDQIDHSVAMVRCTIHSIIVAVETYHNKTSTITYHWRSLWISHYEYSLFLGLGNTVKKQDIHTNMGFCDLESTVMQSSQELFWIPFGAQWRKVGKTLSLKKFVKRYIRQLEVRCERIDFVEISRKWLFFPIGNYGTTDYLMTKFWTKINQK